MNRLKALYRSWGIPCAGKEVYAPRHRAEWLAKIEAKPGCGDAPNITTSSWMFCAPCTRKPAEICWWKPRNHKPWKLLRLIPGIGPIRRPPS